MTVHSVMAPSGKLRGKGRCGVFAGKTERLRGEVLTTRRYTNLQLPLPLIASETISFKVTFKDGSLCSSYCNSCHHHSSNPSFYVTYLEYLSLEQFSRYTISQCINLDIVMKLVYNYFTVLCYLTIPTLTALN